MDRKKKFRWKSVGAFILCLAVCLNTVSYPVNAEIADGEQLVYQPMPADTESLETDEDDDTDVTESETEMTMLQNPQEIDEPEQMTGVETKISDAVVLVKEIKDVEGNVICTVRADVPAGAFDDNTVSGDIDMEVSEISNQCQENIINMMKCNLPEHAYIGNSLIYKLTWKVKGEITEPSQIIKVIFEPSNFVVRDNAKKVKAFGIGEADAENNNIDGFYNIINEQDFSDIQKEMGRNDNVEENITSGASLNENGNANSIYLKTFGSQIYGFYVSQTSEEKEFVQTLDGVTIKLKAKEGSFATESDNVTMQVNTLSQEQIKVIEAGLEEQAITRNKRLNGFVGYDISLWSDGSELQPQIPVEVIFENMGIKMDADAEGKGYQLNDNNQLSIIDGITDGNGNAMLTAEHFTPTLWGSFAANDAPDVQTDGNGAAITSIKVDGDDVNGNILAGSNVTIFGTYTNKTGKNLDGGGNAWYFNVDPGVPGGDFKDSGGLILNGKQNGNLKNNDSVNFSYEFKIPESMKNGHKTFSFQVADKNQKKISAASLTYTVQPLDGVQFTLVQDHGTDLKKGILCGEFGLTNYGSVDIDGYQRRVIVKKNGEELTSSSYIVNWEKTEPALIVSGQTVYEAVSIQLADLPNAGDSYELYFQYEDDTKEITSGAVNAVRERSDVTITPDREGPFQAGEEVTFTVKYTNNTGGKLNSGNWRLVPGIDNAEILKESRFSNAVPNADLNNGLTSSGITFTMKIPETLYTSEYINFSIGVESKNKEVWSSISGASDYYAFKVTPLEGVMVVSAKDKKSNLEDGLLDLQFDLHNYNIDDSRYSYQLIVKAVGNVLDESAYEVIWNPELPGMETAEVLQGSGLIEGLGDASAGVRVQINEDEINKFSEYEVELQVTDMNSGKISEKVINLEAFNNLREIVPEGLIVNGNRLSFLYYGNVEKDTDAPFHNETELISLLMASSKERAKEIWYRYRYDLYDPNCFMNKGMIDPTCTTASDGKNYSFGRGDESKDYPFFDDPKFAYVKDEGNTPFHKAIKDTVMPLSYALDADGINYSDYMKKLNKTAGPDDGDDNTKREYTINLEAETTPKKVIPRVFVFQIQTSWQMFDLEHANRKKGDGIEVKNGACSYNTEMANLYNVKKALIRFAEFLKDYDNGSTLVGITNVQHGITASMVEGSYLTNDMDGIIDGLLNWDTFGDCEHVHYGSTALENAMNNIPGILGTWRDASNVPIGDHASKSVIVIGGPTENNSGKDGYGGTLPDMTGMDHVFGIRTNEGTTTQDKYNKDGKDITGWLDNDTNQTLFKRDGNGFYVAPSEDEVFDSLVKIYEKVGESDELQTNARVEDVVISDTVQKEFEVIGVKAFFINDDGEKIPALLSKDSIKTQVNDDGSTTVTVKYGSIIGKKKLHVEIQTRAKDDYIGSNNVYTNVKKPTISYKHNNAEYRKTYTQTPQVHVPITVDVPDGRTVTVAAGTNVNLKDLAKDINDRCITENIEDLMDNYPQTDGTLTYQWVMLDENGNIVETVGTPSSVPIVNGSGNHPVIPDVTYTTTEGDKGKTVKFALQVTFTPINVLEDQENPNTKLVTSKSDTGKVGIRVPGVEGRFRIKKIVENYETVNEDDRFIITISYDNFETNAILKHTQVSPDILFENEQQIIIKEVLPQEYELSKIKIYDNVSGKYLNDRFTEDGRILVKPGEDLTIEVYNTFSHEGYFKGKDDKDNHFIAEDED